MSFKYIFEVKVSPGKDREFIEHWHNGSIPIQECQGALGTRLLKKRGEEGVYLAVAEWKTKEDRDAAMKEIQEGKTERAKAVAEWGKNEDYGTVTRLGNFDEIDDVLPGEDRVSKSL
mgnify:CR=1 FL=1